MLNERRGHSHFYYGFCASRLRIFISQCISCERAMEIPRSLKTFLVRDLSKKVTNFRPRS